MPALVSKRLPLRGILIALVLLAMVLAAALLGIGWVGSDRALHPAPREEPFTPDDFGLQVEEVAFASLDGTPLVGWFVRGRTPGTVILVHGYGNTRRHLLEHAGYLVADGYSALLFDLRGSGQSGGDVSVGAFEPLDVRGAVDYLAGRPDVDAGCIMAQGISLGAASAIIAAAAEPRIQAVVAEAAFKDMRSTIATSFEGYIGLPSFPFAPVTTWIVERRLGTDADEISPQDAIGRIAPRPVFIIHDLADERIAADSGEVLAVRAGEPKRAWFIEGAGHGEGIEYEPEEYPRRVLEFYREFVPGCAP